MAKKVIGNLKLRIPGGKATAGPPVGSTLGQWGLNMMDFIKMVKTSTEEKMDCRKKNGNLLPSEYNNAIYPVK